MKYTLPDRTKKLVNHYLNIKIGDKVFPCPYYQNIGKIRKDPVFVGKGLPNEIERETQNLLGRRISFDTFSIRLYMVMAGLGIDCSGFATRILDSFLKETINKSVIDVLRPLRSDPLSLIRYKLKPYTNISADMLTSLNNNIIINKYDEVRPGDLLRIGKHHVGIVIENQIESNGKCKITYAHSTSDYQEMYGVRIGKILITNPSQPLEKQKWEETYKGINWMYKDFVNAPENDRGIRRLRVLQTLS